jgi:hypothetical protein
LEENAALCEELETQIREKAGLRPLKEDGAEAEASTEFRPVPKPAKKK